MPPLADIAAPERMRRLGLAWFVAPLFLVAIWLVASPHHVAATLHIAQTGVAGQR